MTGHEARRTDAAGLLEVLRSAADAVEEALEHQQDWSLTGGSHHQYHHDVVADAAAIAVLGQAGLGVFSEESGLHHPGRPVLVALDPVDGSTNASRGLPWWAVSLCALDAEGPLAAVVSSPRTGERFEAVRGQGARRNGVAVHASGATELSRAVIAFNGYPTEHYHWAQFRSLGAAAMDLCALSWGAVDGFVDCSQGELAPWDYLGGLLVCQEAGALVTELYGRELVVRQPGQRRALVAASSKAMLHALTAARLRQPPA